MKKDPDKKISPLAGLPSVDELLKSPEYAGLLKDYPRALVVQAIRETIAAERKRIAEKSRPLSSREELASLVAARIGVLSSFSLRPVINATGIVLHTNLGRAALSERAIRNVLEVSRGYSNLEYDLTAGRRGKRHVHTARLLRQLIGAEDALIVNNNAAAVFLCLNTLAKCREVIVSRGELVEIGGSFRVPDVMTASGAVLREVGTTNKTHLHDYRSAINQGTGLILKVHQSNYQVVGFTEDVPPADLVPLGREHGIPVMFDLGSGCLIDLKPFGIHAEPSVQEILKTGVDIVTFSGDKLLGGPQGGIIVGRKDLVEQIRRNPLARAVRVDKMTIAAFEATLMDYIDPQQAIRGIPVLNMLFQPVDSIRKRARKIAAALRRKKAAAGIRVISDVSRAGGGSLPEASFETYAVSVVPELISVNDLEARLRSGELPVISRIRDNALLLDARTVSDRELVRLVQIVAAALSGA